MKRIVASLLTIVLLLSHVTVSIAEEYDTFRLLNYTYQVPTGWLFNDYDDDAYHIKDMNDPYSDGIITRRTVPIRTAKYIMKDNKTLIEVSVSHSKENERSLFSHMDLEKIGDMTIAKTQGLLYAGSSNIDNVSLHICFVFWIDLDNLYYMGYLTSESSLEQVIEYSKSLFSRIKHDQVRDTSTEYKIVKEYKWASTSYQYNHLVIKNTSGFDARIEVDVLFLDKDGNVVDSKHYVKSACENGYETYWAVCIDKHFERAVYSVSLSPDLVNEALQSIIELSTNIEGKQVTVLAKNTRRQKG